MPRLSFTLLGRLSAFQFRSARDHARPPRAAAFAKQARRATLTALPPSMNNENIIKTPKDKNSRRNI